MRVEQEKAAETPQAFMVSGGVSFAGPRGRLTWTGDMAQWDFAIYKYSNERYDPEEWMFYGAEHLDGTVKGALRACMEAYP